MPRRKFKDSQLLDKDFPNPQLTERYFRPAYHNYIRNKTLAVNRKIRLKKQFELMLEVIERMRRKP